MDNPEPYSQGVQGGMEQPRKSFANQFLSNADIKAKQSLGPGRKDISAIQKQIDEKMEALKNRKLKTSTNVSEFST
jgi:hypothetical protein